MLLLENWLRLNQRFIIEALKVTTVNSAAIKELQQKSAKKATSNCGVGNSNGGDNKTYRDCKTCGKQYPGIYWDLEKGNNNQKKRGRKFLTRGDAKEYMKSIFAEQRKSHDSDSSDSDSEDES